MPKKNKLGNKNQPRNDGDFEGEWNEEVAESSIEDGSMSMSPDFPLYGNCTMNVGDSNDLHIYVNCKSDEDSSFLDNDFDNGMLLLNENESKNKSSSLCIKIFVMAWIIILILCVIFREKIGNVIKMFANKVSKLGPISFLYYILALSACFPVFMPIELMIMSSGFVFSKIYGKLWGILFASLSSFVGYLIGSSICFIISKYLLYNGVKRIFCSNKYYNSINRTADNMGLRVVAMLRISPLLPHAVSNNVMQMISYILGTTDVTFFCFSVGNFAAYPGIFVLSYIGSILGYVVTDMSFFLNAESVILTILGISLSAVGKHAFRPVSSTPTIWSRIIYKSRILYIILTTLVIPIFSMDF